MAALIPYENCCVSVFREMILERKTGQANIRTSGAIYR